jgi:DNA-binding transcriptional MerR regulator
VALALAGDFPGVNNGRVRDVPDQRAIRYYTTLGLLDRPAEMRGRVAYYGRRHLLQLVAIKRLQARGLSLAQVQEQLLGLSDSKLEELAAVRADLARTGTLPSDDRSHTAATSRRERRFWAAAARRSPVSLTDVASRVTDAPETLTLVPVGAGLSLGIAAGRAITPEDIAALHAAAEPVRQVLLERRLVRPS